MISLPNMESRIYVAKRVYSDTYGKVIEIFSAQFWKIKKTKIELLKPEPSF